MDVTTRQTTKVWRPSNYTTAAMSVNNWGNTYDWPATPPDTTTVGTGSWPQATTSGFVDWYQFSGPSNVAVDSWWTVGIRMYVASLAGSNPDYWSARFTLNGTNWTTLVGSRGREAAYVTFQTSVTGVTTFGYAEVVLDSTRVGGADAAGRVYVSDVYFVGTLTYRVGVHAEVMGVTDAVNRSKGNIREPYEAAGVTDYNFRTQVHVRIPE